MANDRCNNGAENDVVELEAMRKDSFSWHPCQISLCSRGVGVTVEYEDDQSEEAIAEKDEILTRIRVRSNPLQGDDCSYLRQGDRVLAAQSSDAKSVFCDALVEKVIHVRHSKRTHCRCSFTVKWVHRALEEARTVPASAIMKLSTKSIDIHPTISTFFGMLESPNCEDTSLSSKNVDNLNWEVDINVLLEKQIEEISNSTDVSLKKISKNFTFGLEVGVKGQSCATNIDASSKESHVLIPVLNNLKGYNLNGNNKPTETKDETPPYSVSSIQKEFNGSKLPLNPLAARAALASLRSELSVQSNAGKGNVKSITDDIPLNVSGALGVKSPNFEGIVKSLFPISSAPEAVDFSDVSTRKGKKNKISGKKITQTSEVRLTRSRIQKSNDEGLYETSVKVNSEKVTFAKDVEKHNYSRKSTRSAAREENTRSRIQQSNDEGLWGEDEMSDKVDSEKVTFAKEAEKHNYSRKRTRSAAKEETTRSRIQKSNDEGILGKDETSDKVDSEEVTLAKDTEKHNYSKKRTRSAAREETTRSQNQKSNDEGLWGKDETSEGLWGKDETSDKVDSKEVSFAKDAEKHNSSRKKTRSAAREEASHSRIQKSNDEGLIGEDETSDKVDSEKVTFAKDAEKHNSSRKKTRSAAREETKKNNVQLKSKVRKSDFSETNEADLFKGGASTESKKAKTTPKTAEGGQGTKKKPASSKNQETRFSPRLRLLAQTHSPTKA